MNTTFKLGEVKVNVGDINVEVGNFEITVEDYNIKEGIELLKIYPSILREIKAVMEEDIVEKPTSGLDDYGNGYRDGFESGKKLTSQQLERAREDSFEAGEQSVLDAIRDSGVYVDKRGDKYFHESYVANQIDLRKEPDHYSYRSIKEDAKFIKEDAPF